MANDQVQKWADEAEAGYDVEKLKRRGRVRPDEERNLCR